MLAEIAVSLLMTLSINGGADEPAMDYLGTYEISAYSAYEGGGENLGTASGMEPVPWYTVATSEDYPFGTVLYIEDVGEVVVADRGGPTIQSGGRIDLFVGWEDPEVWGLQTKEVYLVRWPQ